MSIRQGEKLIASSTTNGFGLFDCKWSDHILNNISWLRADTFSWQSGNVYKAAYEHLVTDFQGTTADTETIAGIQITYYSAEDGHKICLPDQEDNISALYDATGVAWYYILDTDNQQFKLPRTKFGFTGLRDNVGNYVEPGLPNITGTFTNDVVCIGGNAATGAFSGRDSGGYYGTNAAASSYGKGFDFDASLSDPIYGASTTVQSTATQMYLYFYVGNYIENATTVDVGKLTEIVNDFDIGAFKPEVDEAKNSAIVDISDAKTDAIDSLTNLATDLGSSLKYGNVGDIFYTSRLDVSLNGAVECNGNLYNTTDFSGAQSIGNLLRDSKVPYISLSEHQTTVDTYGSCRCFGWDGGTEFRVPKLTDVFIEAGTAESEGEFITAGLPNITGTFRGGRNYGGSPSGDCTGAFWLQGTTYNPKGSDNSSAGMLIGFNASLSSSIYGNSSTVQPPAVRYRAMVQLAFGATDDSVVTASEVVADVAELNSHRVIAFQAPTADNNYTWYRKYADGWVEQGGFKVIDSSTQTGAAYTTATVTFPIALAVVSGWSCQAKHDRFNAGFASDLRGAAASSGSLYQVNDSTGSFSNPYVYWEIKGMAANQ